jgi:exosortase/archaeosortase family protein
MEFKLGKIDAHIAAKLWVAGTLLVLTAFFIFTSASYLKIDAIGIWILSGIAILYRSRKEISLLSTRNRIRVVVMGIFVCIFSFINIPIGFGNPPYSIGDFSIFLSGLGLVFFGFFGFKSLLLPVSFPLIAVLGFQSYELFLRHQEWLASPLVPPTIAITLFLLNLVGINAYSHSNIISFSSKSGVPIQLAIVADCTGIWSLGTFTIATLIVLTSFPQAISRKGALLIFIGYIGTYVANIVRVFMISLSGYFYGPAGVIERAHIHIGWVIFSTWMIIFWYYFFTQYLGFSLLGKNEEFKRYRR